MPFYNKREINIFIYDNSNKIGNLIGIGPIEVNQICIQPKAKNEKFIQIEEICRFFYYYQIHSSATI